MSKNYDFTFAQREEGFDDHIEHSIRGYKNLLDDIVSLSRNFVEDETNVIDIGCSTGKLTEAFIKGNQSFCKYANYVGIELAPSFFIVSSQIFFVSSSLSCFGRKALITSISLFSTSSKSLRPAFL